MVKLSIITPSRRIQNLPAIYRSILKNGTDNIEWIIVYDSKNIDYRIMAYEEFVPIKLFNVEKLQGDSYASRMRNIGLEYCTGDYIYYLDDDNLIHPDLYQKICNHSKEDELLIFNQFSEGLKKRIIDCKYKLDKPGSIDTGQIVVPKKFKYILWENDSTYIDECSYIQKLSKEVKKINFVDRVYTYKNYLRRFDITGKEF